METIDKIEVDEEMLLEQYKLFVDSAHKVTEQRNSTNKFYISLLSGIITAMILFFEKIASDDYLEVILFVVGCLGTMLCYAWYSNIKAYKQLNSAKFKVIHEMEQYLPISCFDREWEILGRGENKDKYLKLTSIEEKLPILLAIPYILIGIIAIILA
ncbi:hypothetical protein [Tissierella sp.]|uniref:RipA family octameric membrane protein n=1 Tax=Tissierella sp. TaxID=41274 RepID=UPI003063B282